MIIIIKYPNPAQTSLDGNPLLTQSTDTSKIYKKPIKIAIIELDI